jgi:hypothetical protein
MGERLKRNQSHFSEKVYEANPTNQGRLVLDQTSWIMPSGEFAISPANNKM